MFNSGDILLFALSARRRVSWPLFKKWFEEVYQREVMEGRTDAGEAAAGIRWHALRTMSCLGHIDIHFGEAEIQIMVAPPALAALPGRGLARAVLCGARSPGTIETLKDLVATVDVDMVVRSSPDLIAYHPTRVELVAETPAHIRNVAIGMDLLYVDAPPARSLARVAASLQEYRRRLVWAREPELNWRREDFDTLRLQFGTNEGDTAQIRLSRYQNPITSMWHYQLWQNGESAEIDLDWGRYSILALSSRNVLQYDPSARRVRVPYGAPLPTLFARSLGLCSGNCSIQSERVSTRGMQRYYVFDDVPPSVFNSVANKLMQRPIETGAR